MSEIRKEIPVKEEINRMWEAYKRYKETAEQHEFVRLFMLDSRLVPAYNDLQNNYTEEHAEIFKKVMERVLSSLGVNWEGTL